MEKPPVIYVVWEDATLKDSGTWHTTDEKKGHVYEPAIFHTVGFLLKEDEKGLIITSAWSPDTVAPRDQIPIGMVREMKYLKGAVKWTDPE